MRTLEAQPHEIADYQANGFIVIPNFLDDEELHTWQQKADVEVDGAPGGSDESEKGFHESMPRAYSMRTVNLSLRDESWRALLCDPRIARFAAALEALPSVRYAGDSISYQDPHCPSTPFHNWWQESDWPSDHRHHITVQMWLDDNTVQNKAMLFLPGTHKTEAHRRTFPGTPASFPREHDAGFLHNPDWMQFDPIATTGPAGSALFYNVCGVHGSGSNMTRRRRRYVGITWMPADAQWNGALGGGTTYLTEEMVEGLSPGDVLDLPEFPVLWP